MALNFPPPPLAKLHIHEGWTPESNVVMKLTRGEKINKIEENVLEEAIQFYKKAFLYLKTINLSEVTNDDINSIYDYLKVVFNLHITPTNTVNFHNVFRVSIINDSFLYEDKVRDSKYLTYPPQEIIEKMGVYGRANSPNSTIFYCSAEPGVAILETKPKVGQRIIISQWHNKKPTVFTYMGIANNKTIDNRFLKDATRALEAAMKDMHPLLAKVFDIYLEFLSSEFIKDVPIKHPKRCEYLFSSFFTDSILDNKFSDYINDNKKRTIDCIIYPSVASKHKYENLGITPNAVKNLELVYLEESIVLQTMYENPDLSENKLPIIRSILRKSTAIQGSNIFWDDDTDQ